jgi:type IV secretory pathway TrbD component
MSNAWLLATIGIVLWTASTMAEDQPKARARARPAVPFVFMRCYPRRENLRKRPRS